LPKPRAVAVFARSLVEEFDGVAEPLVLLFSCSDAAFHAVLPADLLYSPEVGVKAFSIKLPKN
jgi:hypothetical protein